MAGDIVNSRTSIGAGIGAVVGFMFGGPPGAAVGALLGGGVAHASGESQRGVMTPRRKVIYKKTLESVKSPEELKTVADAFAGEGLYSEAFALRKRAELRALPAQVKEQRRNFFRKAMASDDVDTIRSVADAFEKAGAVDAARALSDHADAVAAAHAAGKSCKPLAGGQQQDFADKLAKALVHFGPASSQAQIAAATLIRARGRAPTPAAVADVIRIALQTLNVQAPPARADAAPVEIAVPGDPGPEPVDVAPAAPEAPPPVVAPEALEVTEAVAEVATTPDRGAPEPTVVGPPAPALEPPAPVVRGAPESAAAP